MKMDYFQLHNHPKPRLPMTNPKYYINLDVDTIYWLCCPNPFPGNIDFDCGICSQTRAWMADAPTYEAHPCGHRFELNRLVLPDGNNLRFRSRRLLHGNDSQETNVAPSILHRTNARELYIDYNYNTSIDTCTLGRDFGFVTRRYPPPSYRFPDISKSMTVYDRWEMAAKKMEEDLQCYKDDTVVARAELLQRKQHPSILSNHLAFMTDI